MQYTMVYLSITYWEILLSTTIFQMKICGYRVIAHNLNTRINILLGYFSHWLMSLTWGSHVHTGLWRMAREQLMPCLVLVLRIFWERILSHRMCSLIVLVKWLNILLQRILYITTIRFQWTAFSRQVNGHPMIIRVAWNSTFLFSNPRKKFSTKNISVIAPLVHNLILKNVIMKMPLIMVRMMQIWKLLSRKLSKLNGFLIVSLFSESTIEPLYFLQITEKGVAKEDISDPYVHFASKDMRYFQKLYFKAVRSKNSRVKKFSTIPTRIVMTPRKVTTLMSILMILLSKMLIHAICWLESHLLKIRSLIFHNERLMEFS